MPFGNPGRVIFLNGTSRSTNGSMCGLAMAVSSGSGGADQ
jgi:hypothetical protein